MSYESKTESNTVIDLQKVLDKISLEVYDEIDKENGYQDGDYDNFDDYQCGEVQDDRLWERNHSNLYKKGCDIGIALTVFYGRFNLNEELMEELISRGMDKKEFEQRTIFRTDKKLIELLLDYKGRTKFNFLRVVMINEKYFEGPGFWRIVEKEGTEYVKLLDKEYDLWKSKKDKNKSKDQLVILKKKGAKILALGSEYDDKTKLELMELIMK